MNGPPTRRGRPPEGTPNDDKMASDGQPEKRTTTLRRFPAAFASRYEPHGRRTCWWIAYRCPHCDGAGHLGRSPAPIKTGARRAACGRIVWLVIARTYRAGALVDLGRAA